MRIQQTPSRAQPVVPSPQQRPSQYTDLPEGAAEGKEAKAA